MDLSSAWRACHSCRKRRACRCRRQTRKRVSNQDRKKTKPGAIASAGLYPMDGGSVVVPPAFFLDDDALLGVAMFPAAMPAAIPAVMMAAIHVTTLTSVLDDDFGVLGLGRRGHRHHKSDGGKRRQRENNLAHWVAPR